MAHVSTDLDARMRVVERLVKVFQLERIVCVFCNGAGLVLLVVAVARLVLGGAADGITLTTILGSGGLMALATSRLFYMFNYAIKLIMQLDQDTPEDGKGDS